MDTDMGGLGDMEQTMFRAFCNAQELRSMTTRSCLPLALTPFIDLFNETFRPRTHQRGTLLSDTLAFSQVFEVTPPLIETDIHRLPSRIRSLLTACGRDGESRGVAHSSLVKRG